VEKADNYNYDCDYAYDFDYFGGDDFVTIM
jgi:hypothetical protein